MPLDTNRVGELAAAVASIYREAETALIRTVRDRLAPGIDQEGWAERRLTAVGTLRAAAGRVVTALAFTANQEVRRAVAAGYRSGNADAVADLAGLLSPTTERPPPPAGAAAVRGALAVQSLADAVVRELRPVHAAILPQVEGVYRQAVAGAAARKTAGAATMREAAQAAYAALVSRGITGYTDTAGRRWRLHTYVEMAARTAVTRAAVWGMAAHLTARGVRLVSVDDMPGECARCRPYEHQVLALWGPTGLQHVPDTRTGALIPVDVVATLDAAMAAGLYHPHCRHSIRGYLPGVSMLIKQGRTADPAGAAARDRQRQIERHLRHWRELTAAALTDQGRRRALAYVAAWDREMSHHITATGLTRHRYRERVGAGVVPPAGRVDQVAGRLGVPTQPTLDL